MKCPQCGSWNVATKNVTYVKIGRHEMTRGSGKCRDCHSAFAFRRNASSAATLFTAGFAATAVTATAADE